MGCASSSPFISTAGNGALKTANDATTKVLHSGEEAITDIKDSLEGKVGHVKDAIVGAAQNVGHEIENAFSSGKKEIKETENTIEDRMDKLTTARTDTKSPDFRIIPLKDPNDKMVDDALDEIASTMDDTTAEIKDESEKLIDNILNDTRENLNKNMQNTKDNLDNIIMNSDNTDLQSLDSLKTSSPDPEIERILSNDRDNSPPTPKPTISELEKLHAMGKSTINKIEDDVIDVKDNVKRNLITAVNSIEKEINTAITNT